MHTSSSPFDEQLFIVDAYKLVRCFHSVEGGGEKMSAGLCCDLIKWWASSASYSLHTIHLPQSLNSQSCTFRPMPRSLLILSLKHIATSATFSMCGMLEKTFFFLCRLPNAGFISLGVSSTFISRSHCSEVCVCVFVNLPQQFLYSYCFLLALLP